MRIGFIGSRGIPRCYSGFETCVEEVATRLVARGHEVTVYNRIPFNPYREKEFRGVRIVCLPTLPTKGTDTLFHSGLCTLHGIFQGYDLIYICGVGSAVYSGIWRLFGVKSVVNVDGADWTRAKWGTLGKTWLRWSEGAAAKLADVVIADHPAIAERYWQNFRIKAEVIPYGAEVVEADPGQECLKKLGLSSKGYFLFVSRLTPENGAAEVMEAHLKSGVKLPLVVVGDAPYQTSYKIYLQRLAGKSEGRIHLTGFVFGEGYQQLSYHARAYIFPTAIDATRPVLLEQMGMGAVVIARDTPANRHILGDAALYFSPEDDEELSSLLKYLAGEGALLEDLAERARERIRRFYNWETVVDQYEALFQRLVKGRK
ncbi:MAG: DUF1972 domain-containing protein [Chthoniobacterales bacterium]|nr:DUF1972 domain-containing protein [Chthoniobacterales bacterium]